MLNQRERSIGLAAALALQITIFAGLVQAQNVSFVARRDFDAGLGATSVAVGDFNGDGRPDLAVARATPDSGNVAILLGNGDGTFRSPRNFATGLGPTAIAVGDFNGDGKADLAVANVLSNNVSVLLGNGDGSFQAARNFATGVGPMSVAVGDFNGDGKLDLAVANRGTPPLFSDGSVSVLLGNGDGTFGPPISLAVGANPQSVAVGDYNGDGRLDLAVADANSNDGSVLLGNGDGTFRQALMIAVGSAPTFVAVGDFNGDGVMDLLVANLGSSFPPQSQISVLLGIGDGSFRSPVSFPLGANPAGMVIGDFNGDGVPDVVVPQRGVFFGQPGSLAVLLGVGDGAFLAPRRLPLGGVPTGVAIGDFNGDGFDDVVTPSQGGKVEEFLGNGDGTFQSAESLTVGGSPTFVASGDFNGDGFSDLVISNPGAGGVTLLLGNGDGTFQQPRNIPVAGSGPLLAADLDGDGRLDLVVVGSFNLSVIMLLGNGDGTFQPPRTLNPELFAFALGIGDFNGDGKLDLVAAGAATGGPNNIAVFLGNGDGSFQAPRRSSSGGRVVSLAVGDFNGDTRLDLAVAHQELSTVVVLLGSGDGSFQTLSSIPVGSFPASVAVGDINGDGVLDLAVANSFSGNVSVLLGIGDGSFQAAFNFATGVGPAAVVLADFNGDGLLDLAVANSLSNNASVLLNRGTAGFQILALTSFQGPADFGAGTGPTSLVVADFNGDGLPDLAAVNRESGSVSVLINNTPPPVP